MLDAENLEDLKVKVLSACKEKYPLWTDLHVTHYFYLLPERFKLPTCGL